ncbi:MAG: hypothetical protein EBR30_28585, partial [Cytophagia bacterium]|nr:hypothetical protein [Cytophagia bacterium]
MKKMRIALLLSIITCSVNAQQWSGDNNLTSTIYRNGSIGVNGLYLGRYGSSLSGDSNPYTISSYDNEMHDLIMYGNSASTLHFRLYDGDLKLGSNTIPNIILYNSGSAFFSGNLGVGTTTPVNKLQIGNNPFGYNGNDLVVCNENGALAIHNDVSHTYLYSNRDIAIRPGGGLMSIYAKSDGKVGIGSSNPEATLQITSGQRDYQVNRIISGITEDNQGKNYLLLHRLASGSPVEERYVMGKISGLRGGVSAWNRKWTIEVNTSSAYVTNRGSILTYNEPASLVTVIYQGVSYLAIEIAGQSTLYDFSFTGYANNEDLRIVFDQDITGAAQPFTNYDPFTVQGNVGIGTTNPTEKLTVNGN